MCLDLQGSSVASGTHFQQYPTGDPSELFQITYANGNEFVVETTLNSATERMVMDGRSDCKDGAQVILYPYDDTLPEQKWIASRNENGTYCLSPKKDTSLNLPVDGQTTCNAKVILRNGNADDPSQQWYINTADEESGAISAKIYYLRNKKSGKYLDLQSNGTTNGTHFQQYTFGTQGYPSEQFRISENSDGYFTVKTMLTTNNMVMDGRSNCVNGAQVILYNKVANAPEQEWHLRRNDDDGTYCLSPKKNVYLNLAVEGGSTANNAKVKLEDRSFTYGANNLKIFADNQKWYLEPINISQFDYIYMFEDDDFSNISSGYRDPERPTHYAIDIIGTYNAINGQNIYAPVSGKVVYYVEDSQSSGTYVVIETDMCYPGTGKKLRLTFAHMNTEKMNREECKIVHYVNKRICRGDIIGYVGSTGESSGPHLHHAIFMPGSSNQYWENSNTCYNPQFFYTDIVFSGTTSNVFR